MRLQLHAAVVELTAGAGAEIKYSTVQNWYSGNEEGVGGIYNFVTKRGLCHGDDSKISWTQVWPLASQGFLSHPRTSGPDLGSVYRLCDL